MAMSRFHFNKPRYVTSSLTYAHYVYQCLISREGAKLLEQSGILESIAVATKTCIFLQQSNCKKNKDKGWLEILGIIKEDISKCVSLITEKMPFIIIKKVSFNKLTPIRYFMELTSGVNNNIFISTIVSTEEIYVHLITSYKQLKSINFNLNNECNIEKLSPIISPELGTVCIAPGVTNGWYRVAITSLFQDNFHCIVKYLDYGGQKIMPLGFLKKIPETFLQLPFQAIECKLANIIPKKGNSLNKFLWKLVYKKLVKAQIFRVGEDGVPEVYLFVTHNDRVLFINEELIIQKYVEPKPN